MRKKSFTTFLLLLIFISPALFGAPPDSGQLLNKERQPAAKLPDRIPQEKDESEDQSRINKGEIKVIIKGFRFSGNEGLATDAELQSLIGNNIGKEVEASGLQMLVDKVTRFLKEKKGYFLAKAYLPKQDITEGIIEIAIVAGRIDGKPRINLNEPGRINKEILEKIAGRSIKEGSPVRMEDIEEAVLLMNDLPGISSRASLSTGEVQGSTKLGIDVKEGSVISGLVSSDNYGDRYTGVWRGTGQASINDYFGIGDQFRASFTGAQDMYQGTVGYSIPIFSPGLLFSLAYTGLNYEFGRDLESLNIEGEADDLNTDLNYAIIRSRKVSLWVNAGGEYISLNDEANNVPISDRELLVGNLSISGSFFDSFSGGGMSIANFSFYRGDLDLSGISSAEAGDRLGPQKSGGFTRVTYNVARLQRITELSSMFLSIRGQIANKNLDSSQKIIMGGPTGIRAYPVGEAAGDEGHILTLETRFDYPKQLFLSNLQFVGFIDTGHVTLNNATWSNSISNATNKNNYWLAGAGVGIIMTRAELYSIRASYAHKIGKNPGRSITGYDSDNLNDRDRFWLQAVAWF